MISKKEFEIVFKKFPPSKLEVYHYRYYSRFTLKRQKWVLWLTLVFLFIPFIVGIFLTILQMPLIIITIPAMIYGVFLIILGLPALCVKIQFLIRVGKINKELKITMKEFNELAKKYYATRESAKSLEEFIKNNVL